MHLVRQLPGYAFDGFALLSMIFLTAFSVGYSRLISAYVAGVAPGGTLRLAGLSFVFSIASTAVLALIVLGLARREAWRDDQLPPPRLGAFVGAVVGIFLLGLLVQAIWPLVLATSYHGGDKWIMTAARLPTAVLQVILFPLLVWEVALARGSSRPSFGEAWWQVWRHPAVLLTVAVLAAVSLFAAQAGQWVSLGSSVSPEVGQIALAAPPAIVRVLEILLAIVVCRDTDRDGNPAAMF